MTEPTFAAFQAEHLDLGFDEVLERVWQPDLTIDTHTHPFAVKARVAAGEVWLTVGDHVRHLKAGEDFELARDVPHAERYGTEGATFWVARRH